MIRAYPCTHIDCQWEHCDGASRSRLSISPPPVRERVGRDGGGQQQRVAVARAVAGQPSILLADEPTGNLDSKNGEAVMGLLQTLHDEGSTICMVAHDPRYADHARREIHLFDGKLAATA